MFQFLFIMLLRISLKIPSLCLLLFFYVHHCNYYSIATVPIANSTMHKCCGVKLQVVFDNITHVILYYKVSSGIVL